MPEKTESNRREELKSLGRVRVANIYYACYPMLRNSGYAQNLKTEELIDKIIEREVIEDKINEPTKRSLTMAWRDSPQAQAHYRRAFRVISGIMAMSDLPGAQFAQVGDPHKDTKSTMIPIFPDMGSEVRQIRDALTKVGMHWFVNDDKPEITYVLIDDVMTKYPPK